MKFLVAGELNLDLILQNYLSFPALGQETLVEDITLTLGRTTFSSSKSSASVISKIGAPSEICRPPSQSVHLPLPAGPGVNFRYSSEGIADDRMWNLANV